MKYDIVMFDFDGTLADSFPFFTSVFNEFARRYRFRTIEPHDVQRLRACSTREILVYVGLPGWKLPLVARRFRAMMREAAGDIPLFHGVDAMLQDLAQRGAQLAVVTSNSFANVKAVLGAENMARIAYFECGASLFGKTSRLARVLRKSGIDGNRALYIGDQAADPEAARAAGIDFGAVAWGYGEIESLKQYRPAQVFMSMREIGLLGVVQQA
ncbi:HAD family hydrolase [Oxalobacteraceae bacterium OM1]|nr:HAD family hydrolase [Oxalobacteraceae bacterium OM1]